jgi:plastocyanin
MKRIYSRLTGVLVFFFASGLVLCASGSSFAEGPATHTINMTVMEVYGRTTTDWQSPPKVDPETLSRGYEFVKPGLVDEKNPGEWEVGSYLFTPSHITIKQGDVVGINAFITNGNAHNVTITAPDGSVVIPPTTWNRGREYKLSFVGSMTGIYLINCKTHAPTMTATIYVIP